MRDISSLIDTLISAARTWGNSSIQYMPHGAVRLPVFNGRSGLARGVNPLSNKCLLEATEPEGTCSAETEHGDGLSAAQNMPTENC